MANRSVAEQHLNLAVDLLSSTTVVAIFYTLVTILYCFSLRCSYAQLRDDRGKIKRMRVCTLVFQTVLMICATLDIIVHNRMVQVGYIDYDALSDSEARSYVTYMRLWTVVNIVEELLIQGVLLWRVRVVWSGTRFVVPLITTLLLIYLASAGFQIFDNVITWSVVPLQEGSRKELIISITTVVLGLANSVLMTSSIIGRLLFIRWRHVKLMGSSNVPGEYLGIATMLIESYALDTLWTIGLLVSFCLRYGLTYNLFSNSLTQVDILTNFLVIYRVLSGRAWTRQTQDRLSTLRWAPDRAGTTTSGPVDLRQTCVTEEGIPTVSFRDNSV